jgi:hypothetical protein
VRYPVVLEGFEGQTIEVQSGGFIQGAKLLINGEPAPKGPKRNTMLLRRNNGQELVAAWKPQLFDVPQLVVEGKTIALVKPLQWYEWLLCLLPVLLVFAGGALGAVCGLVAFYINTQLFRSNQGQPVKILGALLVAVAATIVYLVLGIVLYLLIQPA